MAWRALARAECFAPGVYRFLKRTTSPAITRRRGPTGPCPDATWPNISAGKSKRPSFTAKAIANYGPDCALPLALEPSPGAQGDGRERLARAPSRSCATLRRPTTEPSSPTRSMNLGNGHEPDLQHRGRRAYVFVAFEHANSEIIGIHAARSAIASIRSRRPAVHPCFSSFAPGISRGSSCVTIMAPITFPAISMTRSSVWASKLRRPSCANPKAIASPSASSEPCRRTCSG